MRKLTVLTLVLLYVISLAAVSVFAANAGSVGDHQTRMVPIESRQFPLTEGGVGTSNSALSGKSSSSSTALGYFMSPGILVGSTSYDLQHNMRMDRQVAVGADGRVHFVWTAAPLPFDANLRAINYTSYNPSSAILDEAVNVSNDLSKTPGRFCTVDVFADRAQIVNHWGPGPNCTSAIDVSSGGYSFTAKDPPSNIVNCQGIYAGGANATTFQEYIWPDASADADGAGNIVIHVIASEGNTAGGAWSAIAYFRGTSPNTTMASLTYPTCGMFVDSCQATGYVVAADPYSDKVVIVYPKGRQATRDNNDLAYRLSTDLGVNWGPVVNVTNYHTAYKERCGGDMSVLWGADGFFHILYVTTIYDSAAGTISDPENKLWHWSNKNPVSTGGLTPNFSRSLVLDANNVDAACNTPAFEWNVAKVTLTQCLATNLTPDDTLLYAVYSRQLGTTAAPDCSDKNYYNQEVFFQPSNTWGETWGAPVNLTNTNTDNCLGTVGSPCADDGSSSSAKYVTDSLRIEYLEDLDAGSNVGNETGTASLLNPVKFISNVCIDMAPYKVLTSTPSVIKYPFHAVRNATASQDLLLVNGGNGPITWNAAPLNNGSPNAPVSVPGTGTVTAGLINSATITALVGPCATEGLFKNTIRFSYDDGTKATKTFDVAVDFYVFDSWFLPQDIAIRTANNRMAVNQVSQAAADISKSSFSYFADLNEDFITDASLIMGNAASNMSWKLFAGGQGDPTPSNNFGWLYALTNTTVDSTTWPSNAGYTIAQGRGTNRDTTVEFEVKWYAMHHVDSADYYIGHFDVYKGVKWTTNVTNLSIAYGCDWDVPSDTGSDNTIILDKPRQAIILKGQYTETTPTFRQRGYAALAAWREDNVPITGGFGWGNQQQVYGQGGYHVDSVWKYIEAIAAPPNNYNSTWQDSVGDMSLVLAIAKDYVVTSTSHLKFNVILAAKRAQDNAAGLTGIQLALDKAKSSMCKYASPGQPVCLSCASCGDANGDAVINISDAVYLIAYIFAGGAAPGDCGYAFGKGDANGDGVVNISDAVYLIAYIFAGGAVPHCQGM
jgi:hypothetical protein